MAKRDYRVCFTGHRPDKLIGRTADAELYLANEIGEAIDSGYKTFISGMAAGIDVMAAEAVLAYRELNDIHLIAAMPYPRFGYNWADGWGERIKAIVANADLVINVSPYYTGKGVFQTRNIWMVEHSAKLIAYWDGTAGGTRNTVMYAKNKIQIVNRFEEVTI